MFSISNQIGQMTRIMNIIPILMMIAVSNGVLRTWVTIDDFHPSELVNLTLHQEHELMLQKLVKKEDKLLASAFYYEMLAHSAGNSFFPIHRDENAFREINAITKAVFASAKNLLIQHQVWRLVLRTASVDGAKYVHTFNSFPTAFLLVCADIDYILRNETSYTTLRDEYKKQTYSPPNKVYHDKIAKSLFEEIALIEELMNEPQVRQLYAHLAWMQIKKSVNSTLIDIKKSVLSLAEVPDKFAEVQKIYERSVDDVIPFMKRLDITFTVPDKKSLYFADLQFNMTKMMWARIKEDIPDWKDYFECESDDELDNGRCEPTHVGNDLIFKSVWPVTSDFGHFELQNLTLQQEHELFLKKLVSDHSNLTTLFLYLEFQAKSIGNDFFGLIKDEKSNHRNNAIAKATIDCISRLQLQNRTLEAIALGMNNGTEYVASTDDITQGFIEVCSTIDDELKDETFYITKRDEYMMQNLSLPRKTYQYGVGKPTDDQRKVIAELFNDNLTKRILLHTIWKSARLVKESPKAQTRFAILELAKVPSKTEIVQNIYEQSIEEIVPVLKNFTYNEVFRINEFAIVHVADVTVAEAINYAGLITNLVVSKINERPDLVAIFKAIGKRFEMSLVGSI